MLSRSVVSLSSRRSATRQPTTSRLSIVSSSSTKHVVSAYVPKSPIRSLHVASRTLAKAAAAGKKSAKDPKSLSEIDEVGDTEGEINFAALEEAQLEEEKVVTFAETTALLRLDLPLSFPQFVALLSKSISSLTSEENKLTNKIRQLLSINRPITETQALREKSVSDALRASNPSLREWTDQDLFDELHNRVKYFNKLLDALPTRDTDRRALRSLMESETSVSLRQFMEADLGLGNRSKILRPVLYESKPIEVTQDQLYIQSDSPVDAIFTAKNVGKYLKLTDRDLTKYFPEGLGGHILAREFSSTKTKALLLRQPTLDAIEKLKQAEQGAFVRSVVPPPTVLTGEKGSGKSAVLAQVVFWARKSDWLVFYIPNAFDVTSNGDFIEKSPFFKNESIWDDPSNANRLLNYLLAAHAEKLKTIPIRTKFTLGKLQAKTLFDLVEYGAALSQFSAAAFQHVFNELSRVIEYPVLLACDDYNLVYDFSRYFSDPESDKYTKDMLPARRLSIVKPFFDAHVNPPLAYGTFIGATSETYSVRPFLAESRPEKFGKHWIEVKPYSRKEFDSVVSHYRFSNWVRADVPINTREYLYQLTSGIGSDFWSYSQKL